MRQLTRSIYSVALLPGLLGGLGAPTHASPESLISCLVDLGYTDVGLGSADDTAILTFTNQSHRRLAVALGEVLAIAAQEHPSVDWIRLVPQFEQLPIGCVDVNLKAYRRWVGGSLSDRDFLASMRIRRGAEPLPPERVAASFLLGDLSFFPAAALEYGAALGIQEGWHVSLGEGTAIEAITQQTLVKVGRELPQVPLANLTYCRWLTPDVPIVNRIGYFGNRGWGGQLELGIPVGPVELRLLGGGTERSALEAIARLYARPGFLNLALRAGVGRFLDGDWGYEAGVLRAFERSTLEGTMLKTSHGVDLRAVLTIYLGGSRRPRPGSLRIEPGAWSAYYQPESFRIGRTLLLVDDIETFYQELYPDEVLTRMSAWPRPVLSAE